MILATRAASLSLVRRSRQVQLFTRETSLTTTNTKTTEYHHRCASSAAVAAASPEKSSSLPSTQHKCKPHNVYMWGTSKKGTIPISLLEEDGTSSLAATSSTAAAAGSSSSSAGKNSSGMFSKTDETILDHPMRLNLEEANLQFFLGEKYIEEQRSGNDDITEKNVWLEKVYCGASGTAMVLNDGQCFVMGSSKNGELG